MMRPAVLVAFAIPQSCIDSYLDSCLRSQKCVLALSHEALGHESFTVVKTFHVGTKYDVHKHVVDTFELVYSLEGVPVLSELELTDIPVNSMRKTMKIELVELATEYI